MQFEQYAIKALHRLQSVYLAAYKNMTGALRFA